MRFDDSRTQSVLYSRLTVILLIGAGLRFLLLGYQSLWYDEALSLAMAKNLTLSQILTNFAQSHHPPVYYLLLCFWIKLVGPNDFSLRFISAASSLLCIPLIYQVGRSLFDHKVGILAAFLLTLQPFQIQYAQEARMYALLLLFMLVTLFAFVKAIETNNHYWWGLYLAAFILGLYTHYFIGFVVLVYHLFFVVYWRRYRRIWPAILITDLIAAVAFAPQIGQLLQKSDVFWLTLPPFLYVFVTLYFLTFGNYLHEPLITYVALSITLGLMAICTYEILKRGRKTSTFRWQILLLLGAFIPIATVFIIAQFKPVYLVRSLIICTPFLTLLVAVALRRTQLRSPLPYLTIAAGVLVMVVFSRIYVRAVTTKEPMREAAHLIWQNRENDDLVVHASLWTALPFTFYFEPSENYLLLGNPHPLKPIEVWEAFGGRAIAGETIRADQRVWLVTSSTFVPDSQEKQIEQFRLNRPILSESNLGSIAIHLYGRVN